MVGSNFFMCERKQSNFIFILVFIYFIIIFLINNKGNQHKILKKRPVATGAVRLSSDFRSCTFSGRRRRMAAEYLCS